MADVHTPEQRSRNMSAIKSRNTKPELKVRSLLHRMGYRFRLKADLPGKPDLILRKYRTVVFVHGCFWHRHKGCKFCYIPKSRAEFWKKKFEANVRRDRVVEEQIRKKGWKQLIIWECEIRNQNKLTRKIKAFLPKNK